MKFLILLITLLPLQAYALNDAQSKKSDLGKTCHKKSDCISYCQVDESVKQEDKNKVGTCSNVPLSGCFSFIDNDNDLYTICSDAD